MELTLVLLIFGGKESCQLRLPLFEVGRLTLPHGGDTVPDDARLDHFVRLCFPVGLVGEVTLSSDIGKSALLFLTTN